MRKTLLALSVMTLTSTAMAATTAELVLRGIVPQILSVAIAPTSLATALPLDQAQNDQKVGVITETSNSVTGYKMLARSVKGGKLVNASSANHFVNYTLKYGGNNVPLGTADSQFFTEQNNRGTFSKDLTITYSQPSNLASGEYSDTVTFTIQAN